ncbi:MAG: hypothetical protein PHV23_03930 [Candidatus Gracilibacteria bacterium]|nr:hypothetical protein [Candidatus Gracilibacteria bacterium]
MVEKVKSYVNKRTDETLDFTNETKGFVEDILEIEPCPNCGGDLLNGKCENYKSCGYGHGDDYLRNKEEQRLQKSINMMGNGEKHILKTFGGEELYYFDYFGRIKENEAILEFELDGEVYKVEVEYDIKENNFAKTIENIRFKSSIKKQIKLKNNKIRRNKVFIDYKKLKKYVFLILTDIKFNNFIISK